MNKKLSWIFLFIPVLLILGLFFIPVKKEILETQVANAVAVKGQLAPDFTLNNLKGQKIKLSSFKGKVVLLNFWATWCYPCSMEIPSMESLYKKLKKLDFHMLAVKIKDKPFGQKFVDEKKVKFPVLLDNNSSIALLYGLTGVPESYIIDKKGYITEKVVGAMDWDKPEIIDYLKKLIAEKK